MPSSPMSLINLSFGSPLVNTSAAAIDRMVDLQPTTEPANSEFTHPFDLKWIPRPFNCPFQVPECSSCGEQVRRSRDMHELTKYINNI